MQEAKRLGETEVLDVDGSYLFKKHQQLSSEGIQLPQLSLPETPLIGWEPVNITNYAEMAKKIPRITHGKIYSLSLPPAYPICMYRLLSNFVTCRFVIYIYGRGYKYYIGWRCFSSFAKGFHPLVLWTTGPYRSKCKAPKLLSCSMQDDTFHENRALSSGLAFGLRC